MKSICGANCDECNYNKKCKGCKSTNGCPFGKHCFIADCIIVGGKENYELLKSELINEFNSLKIPGMSKIKDLFPLNGSLINLEYRLPSGKKVKLLDDNDIYLGNQVECEFSNDEIKSYYGLVANMSFILVCEYNEDKSNPEIIIYKRR